jgi:hypothetical protein
VRCTHASPGHYRKLRIGSELDGFCGVRARLEPKDIGADRDRLRLLIERSRSWRDEPSVAPGSGILATSIGFLL